MTTTPGWHPDPMPGQPGVAPLLRYWDGQQWTEHTAPFPDAGSQPAGQTTGQPGQQHGQSGPQHGQSGQQYGAAPFSAYAESPSGNQAPVDQATSPYGALPGYGSTPAGSTPGYPSAYATPGKQTTTPDGAPLASWWHRVGATLIDGVIVLAITAVLYIPFYGRIGSAFSDYLDKVDDATRTGAQPPSSTQLQQDLLPTLVLMSLVSLVFSLVWTVAWLRAKQATPGKLAVGLRIRLRDAPGPLGYGVILRHWAGQYAVGVLTLIPLLGNLFSLYFLLDPLWASWDGKRQTLHDKVAGTNVVRVR